MPSQSKPASAYVHEPLSSVAVPSKLHAEASVQPATSSPSQTPSPSASAKQLPSQSKPASAYVHEPSSFVAAES